MKTNKHDVIAKKNKALSLNKTVCGNCLKTITAAISVLKNEIDSTNKEIDDIDTYQLGLDAIRRQMVAENEKNAKIVHNLSALIGEDEGGI